MKVDLFKSNVPAEEVDKYPTCQHLQDQGDGQSAKCHTSVCLQ